MTKTTTRAGAVLLAAGLWSAAAVGASLGLSGTKLIGAGGSGLPQFGVSAALSGDGNTALVGATGDDNNTGATWVYVRSGSGWTQQGTKLIGTGSAGAAKQGTSVALSADGSTALVGGLNDSSNTGAAWVFTRSGGVWTQQGSKLVGTGAAGGTNLGISVALSADGNTALVGGIGDSAGVGAAWVFTRSGGVWTQQGSKLVGTGPVGNSRQGLAVALSADGNTALVGGYNDDGGKGAVWIFGRSGGVWTQQGAKLVGTGASSPASQGLAAALSADGNTAAVGGYGDNSFAGATWIYTRNAEGWTQQGAKLVGSGALGAAVQGSAVALSADGNTVLVGGWGDNQDAGGAWMFARNNGVWTQGPKLYGSGVIDVAGQGLSVALSADGGTALLGGPFDNTDQGAVWIFGGAPSCTVDFDGNGSIDALTDGLMLLRAMFGLTGSSVTNGAVGSGASRTTWAQIQPYLNGNCGGGFAP